MRSSFRLGTSVLWAEGYMIAADEEEALGGARSEPVPLLHS
jgi:hypothetical protein